MPAMQIFAANLIVPNSGKMAFNHSFDNETITAERIAEEGSPGERELDSNSPQGLNSVAQV